MKERLLITAVGLTIVAAVAGVVFPTRVHTIVALWALVLLGAVLLEMNARTRSLVGARSRFDLLLQQERREPALPEDLKRLERGLGWMTYDPSYFDFRVRPLLRELIHYAALERREIDLLADVAAGKGIVDDELLALVGNRKAEAIYGSGSITTEDITRMVARIEAL